MITTVPRRRTIQPGRGLHLLLSINGAANVVGGALLLPLAPTLATPTGLRPPVLAGMGGSTCSTEPRCGSWGRAPVHSRWRSWR